VGALASVSGDSFSILAAGVNSDGSERLVQRAEGSRAEASSLAAKLGKRMVAEVALR
jgi:porphobilinogen deaminase